MKRVLRISICILFFTILVGLLVNCGSVPDAAGPASGSSISKAFEQRKSDVQVQGEGIVSRVLSDDNEGSRHQRIIVRLASGQTVLVQHNIDLAPRIADLKVGDNVSFFGEYVWNEQGGIIHWTHHDPAGQHVGGWLKHKGRTYE